ncbi:glycoside hydrolase family 3 N-terminal domain-containing protein [Sinomonas susongensis]|uniref:glycoside hydrolase family 3 N-terminal domain-containing protein n=1 Tax=Sinomonas susongensis TaxID=1324851 RepID=UPI001FEBB903|nr:glycoside hydrolase family 3 N-terminal domain-containing protein [Sinomonas susongensis]
MARPSPRVLIAIVASVVLILGGLAAVIVPGLVASSTPPRAAPPTSPSFTRPVPTPRSSTSSPTPSATPPQPSPPASSAPPPSAPPPPQTRAQQLLASMSLEQRAGQVVMTSIPVSGLDAASLAALGSDHIGNVFLKGRTTAGAGAVAGVVRSARAETSSATLGVAPFVATDQEGGQVQILRGPGFSDMPSALAQGSMTPDALRASAFEWGQELAAAGVDVNFAPVMDTVPSPAFAPQNIPIGKYQREFGFTPDAVAAHGIAFAQGMADAGVAATVKHFPGLGRVTGNTDTSTNVTDSTTTRNDAYVAPFADAVRAGVPWVMLSNAFYPAIDAANYAPFSPTVIQGMLRGDLGFQGIVVSDDLCDAAQVSGFLLDHRGADFLAAGGTMALCTNETLAPRVWQGIVDRARSDPGFAKVVDNAALQVLTAKERRGLLPR